MNGLCGANCSECEFYKGSQCLGCRQTNGCPFGRKCWLASYVEIGGKEKLDFLEDELIEEVNSLNIVGMPPIDDLYPLNGSIVNLEYKLPNGVKTKFLQDDEIYLGNQVPCDFNNDEIQRYFGIVLNMSFIMVCEYGVDGKNPELILYKKR